VCVYDANATCNSVLVHAWQSSCLQGEAALVQRRPSEFGAQVSGVLFSDAVADQVVAHAGLSRLHRSTEQMPHVLLCVFVWPDCDV